MGRSVDCPTLLASIPLASHPQYVLLIEVLQPKLLWIWVFQMLSTWFQSNLWVNRFFTLFTKPRSWSQTLFHSSPSVWMVPTRPWQRDGCSRCARGASTGCWTRRSGSERRRRRCTARTGPTTPSTSTRRRWRCSSPSKCGSWPPPPPLLLLPQLPALLAPSSSKPPTRHQVNAGPDRHSFRYPHP